MIKKINQAASLLGLLLCAVLAWHFWKAGLFSSKEALTGYIGRLGWAGPAVFTVFQAVQVVIPILPGGLGCLAGVILFGAWRGFWYNYIGICGGSLAAFAVTRACGRPLLESVFPASMVEKYDRWMGSGSRFARWFAFLIFIPVAPDNYLCFLAGTTRMDWRLYTAIILLCKPASIAPYSLGLTVVAQNLLVLWRRTPMYTVHIYNGLLSLVSKSEVGQAAKHQRAALESVGVRVVTD